MSDIEHVLQVALPLPLPQLFDYRLPATITSDNIHVGSRVRVPFGPGERIGIVAGCGPRDTDASTLREIIAFLDPGPVFHGELLASLQWLARYTHAPLGEVLATALPATLRRGEPLPETHDWAWQLTEDGHTRINSLRTGSKPRHFAGLLAQAARDEDSLDDLLDGWRGAARSLQKRGLVERIAIPASQLAPTPRQAHVPNTEQQAAINAILGHSGFNAWLLDGVTGSGKTEVYLQAIADCLSQGRQALVLVPEIGLTPQALRRFRERLGVPVHALHSGLNDNARARAWTAASRGEARVIVGTRSAVFVPLPQAGLIVIDEEHDASYKQLDGIRYHARDFALVRGKALDVPVILGSATPSLESLHKARSGRYGHLRLRQRAGAATPPRVRVVDVRKRPLAAGLSPEMLAAIDAALTAGGQVLVFRNRRGYAPVLLCHDCGWSAHCRRCSTPTQGTPMTVHAGGRRLQCHHCGARQSIPLACPACASLALQPQGNGTERIEELLVERHAELPVLRIDRGSTGSKDALERHLQQFGTQPGILIGTQMLAKGHDLPNLTLVAVVGIDEGLFSADFRASEKLAQLLIQVAGRAGRADKRGEVLLQTHHPDHPLLHTLINGGYHAFAEAELILRESAGFPPFTHLALLRAEAKHADLPMRFLAAAKERLEAGSKYAADAHGSSAASRHDDAFTMHGPLPAPMPRRAGMHRAQLLLSAGTRRELHRVLGTVMPQLHALSESRKVRWSLDVDPVDLY